MRKTHLTAWTRNADHRSASAASGMEERLTVNDFAAARAIDILSTLIGHPTDSRNSNLGLIEWIQAYLGGYGVADLVAQLHK